MEERDESLTRSAARGGMATFRASSVVAAGSLVAQVALGWLLSDGDFGVYALAIGFSTFLLVFKDGGVRLLLLRQGREGFQRIVGDAFWLSQGFSLAVALALAGASPVVGRVYEEPRIVPVILVLAAATPLGTYPKVASAWLLVDLRFATNARIEIASAALRYALMVGFAFLGLGPLSFALPVIGVNTFEMVAYGLTTRLQPWQAPFSLSRGRELFQRSKWPLAGSFATATFRQSDYIALGLVATTSVVGIYFFAYQFSIRLSGLFTEGLRKVIVPVFAAAATDPHRRHTAAVRGSAFVGTIAAPVLLLVTATAAPLEELLWRGRWGAAVLAIQILSAALPMQVLARFLETITQSVGRFRLWTATITLRGVGLAVAALISGFLGGRDNPTIVAIVIGAYLFSSAVIEIAVLARRTGFPGGAILAAMMPPYLLASSIAIALVVFSEQFPSRHVILHLALASIAFVATYAIGAALLLRSTISQIAPILRHLPGWGVFARRSRS